MPYYPNPDTDSEADPLGYSGRSSGGGGEDGDDSRSRSGHGSGSEGRGRSRSIGMLNVVNGKLAGHLASRQREIRATDSPSGDEYEDAQSELGIREEDEEDEDNEVDLLVPEDMPYELVENTPALREVDNREERINGFTAIQKTTTISPRKPPTAQVAVLINSTPQREAYKAFRSDELDQEEQEQEEDLDPIVTSDLIPSPNRKKKHPIVTPIPPPQIPPFPKRPLPDSTGTALNPPKKRGRPFGWKPGTPYSTKPPKEKKQPSASAATGEVKRRGRPPRQPSPPPRKIYLKSETTKFNLFICEWEGCPAKLQNLDTLRRHFRIVHGNITNNPKIHQNNPTPSVCKWGSCPSKHPGLVLPTREDFIKHIERHMYTQKWYMGDGPQNNSHKMEYSKMGIIPTRGDANPLPRYLFDQETGEQVTPSIRDQEFENDKDRKERMAKLERVRKLMLENAPEGPVYTEEQAGLVEKALKEKRDTKNMYHKYFEAVVERPLEVERLKKKFGVVGASNGKDSISSGDVESDPKVSQIHKAVGGPIYGPEWRGNLLGI